MIVRKKLEEKITKKREEIAALERMIGEANSYLLALQDTLKMIPKTSDAASAALSLRPGTDIAKSYDALKQAGTPLQINDLLKKMGREVNKSNRVSISGSINGYVRRGLIFSKTAPNTFGLLEFESGNEPPEEFGASAESIASSA